MLVYSIGVSVDGFINDRRGGFDWGAPSDDLFRFHLEQVSELGAYLLGRRLYQDMLVWENDASLRRSPDTAAFADVWTALPKVVFSHTDPPLQGTARLARASLREEVEAVCGGTDQPVQIGGATLAGNAVTEGLLDELRIFRYPVAVGGGTRHLPEVTEDLRLDLLETRTFGAQVVFERYRVLR